MSLILHDPDTFLSDIFDLPVRFPKQRAWTPAMNIVEKENGLEASIEVAGMKPDDIKVELKNNHVIISGHKQEERKEENSRYHRYERSSGSFSRSFTVYPGTKSTDISASSSNGILTVFVQKTEKSDCSNLIPISHN